MADLTDAAILDSLGLDPEIHRCEWRAELDRERVPRTWTVRKQLLREGFDGVIYPSFMSPGGTCVALWKWNGRGEPTLAIIDPDGRLPKTPASWA